MDKAIMATVVIALIALAISGMIIAWRKRVNRDKRFSLVIPGTQVTSHADSPLEFSGLYVATTLATNPLQRVTLPGLAFRADAHLLVSASGITIAPRGEKPSFIPGAQIIQIHQSQVTIDKAVEKDGLTAISWTAFDSIENSEVEFTSYFRFSIPEIRRACEDALTSFFPNNQATSKEVAS